MTSTASQNLVWNQVVDELYEPIYRFCWQMLRVSADAEDAVQEVFLKVFQKHRLLRDLTALKPWTYSIARNVCIDKLRKSKRREQAFQTLAADTQPSGSAPELSRFLEEAITRLPRKQREIFILRHWHDFSTAETAEILKVRPGTVKSHLKRAVDTLKTELQAAESERSSKDEVATTKPARPTSSLVEKEQSDGFR